MINNYLQNWGLAERQTPAQNESLKHKLLASFIPAPTLPQKSFSVPWLSLSFASMAIVVFIISSVNSGNVVSQKIALHNTASITQSAPIASPQAETNFVAPKMAPLSLDGVPADSVMNEQSRTKTFAGRGDVYAPAPSYQNVPIKDNREFIKTSYGANVQARQVLQTAESTQVIIRGLKGRMDSFSASDKSAYISFALPEEKLNQLRTELKSLVGARFIIETTRGENLLPEKQSLEQQNSDAQNQLSQLRVERDQLVTKHSQVISSLKTQLASAKKELANIQERSAYDLTFAVANQARLEELQKQISGLNNQIINENNAYESNLAYQDEQIKYQTDYIAGLVKQDNNLMDSVATVQGTISFTQINWMEYVNAYIPLYWFGLLFVGLSLLAYYFHRRLII
ncbi:MAG: hypothetical protein WC794_04880 [Candidatus Doudnabacteria bacterium]|jgi:hypothetical protein